MARVLVKNSGSPSGIDTNARLTFSSKRFKNGILSDSNRIFRTTNGIPGYVYGSRSLNEGEWFNIKLTKVDTNSNWGTLFNFGFTHDPETKEPQWYADDDITKTWCATVSPTGYIFYEQMRQDSITIDKPKIGDVFSLSRTEDGLVSFRYNSVQQNGTSYKSPDGLYPYVYLYGASEVELLS